MNYDSNTSKCYRQGIYFLPIVSQKQPYFANQIIQQADKPGFDDDTTGSSKDNKLDSTEIKSFIKSWFDDLMSH